MGLTWGLSACALGLDEAIDVGVHAAAFKRQPHFLIELGAGESRDHGAGFTPVPTRCGSELWPGTLSVPEMRDLGM